MRFLTGKLTARFDEGSGSARRSRMQTGDVGRAPVEIPSPKQKRAEPVAVERANDRIRQYC
jgi:hypothetical protein